MTLVIDPKVALLKGVDPVQFCVFKKFQYFEPIACNLLYSHFFVFILYLFSHFMS